MKFSLLERNIMEIYRITENSKLSDEDCLKLGREVNEKLARRYGLVK